jgi:hypothetical protein
LACDVAVPKAGAESDRVRASFSIEPPPVWSNQVPPNVQNPLIVADAIANPDARYARRRTR